MKRACCLLLFSGALHASQEVPKNDSEIAHKFSNIINRRHLSEKSFESFKQQLTLNPSLLNLKFCNYTLAQRIDHRIENHIIDHKIEVLYITLKHRDIRQI